MILYRINGTDRSANVRAQTLRITKQLGRRTDQCRFSIFDGTKPSENQDVKIYAAAQVDSVLGAVLTLKDSYQTGVSRFFVGQTIKVRIGETDEATRTVSAYNETTRELTLSSALATVVQGDAVGVLLFGGVVSTVGDSNIGQLSVLEWDVICVDYSRIFDRKLVSDSWQDVDARYIINDFVHRTVNYCQTLDALSYANATAIRAEWIEASDGGNPDVDAANFMEGTAAGVFAWVFAAGSALWEATPTAVDLSEFTGVATGTPTEGEATCWIKSSDIGDISAFYLRIGSDSSNYAKIPFTLVADTDWQFLMSKMTNATIVGVPNWTAVDYIAIELDETVSGTMKVNGIRVCQEGSFTLYNVKPTPAYDDSRAPQLKPSAFMETLAGTWEFVWYIDAEKDIHFTSKEVALCPHGIADTGLNFTDLEVEVDASQIGNRILIRGGERLSTSQYAQVFEGDGAVREWLLKNKFSGLEVTVDDGGTTSAAEVGTTTTNIKITGHGLSTGDHVINRTRSNAVRAITKVDNDNFTVEAVTSQTNGDSISKFATTKTVGVEGITDESTVLYVGNSNEKSVRATATETTLPSGTFIRFEYYERVRVTFLYAHNASVAALKALGFGDGVFDLDPITDMNITDVNTALDMARAKVELYSNPIITGNFRSDQEGFNAGQLINVVDSVRGISTDYVIQRVTMRERGGAFKDYFEIAVEFGTSLFGWTEFMQKLLSTKDKIEINTDEEIETFETSSEEVACADVNSEALGGFKKQTSDETVTSDDVNARYLMTAWKWEASTGQAVPTRWDLFHWG
ncbi:MAG: hypothetical protein PHD04_04170 [Candidatus Pacebacteria bacterium]|nr:hypothetical protein [Candidatus Paceibacterota bacterium]